MKKIIIKNENLRKIRKILKEILFSSVYHEIEILSNYSFNDSEISN